MGGENGRGREREKEAESRKEVSINTGYTAIVRGANKFS